MKREKKRERERSGIDPIRERDLGNPPVSNIASS